MAIALLGLDALAAELLAGSVGAADAVTTTELGNFLMGRVTTVSNEAAFASGLKQIAGSLESSALVPGAATGEIFGALEGGAVIGIVGGGFDQIGSQILDGLRLISTGSTAEQNAREDRALISLTTDTGIIHGGLGTPSRHAINLIEQNARARARAGIVPSERKFTQDDPVSSFNPVIDRFGDSDFFDMSGFLDAPPPPEPPLIINPTPDPQLSDLEGKIASSLIAGEAKEIEEKFDTSPEPIDDTRPLLLDPPPPPEDPLIINPTPDDLSILTPDDLQGDPPAEAVDDIGARATATAAALAAAAATATAAATAADRLKNLRPPTDAPTGAPTDKPPSGIIPRPAGPGGRDDTPKSVGQLRAQFKQTGTQFIQKLMATPMNVQNSEWQEFDFVGIDQTNGLEIANALGSMIQFSEPLFYPPALPPNRPIPEALPKIMQQPMMREVQLRQPFMDKFDGALTGPINMTDTYNRSVLPSNFTNLSLYNPV